jgi:hypothetical protein
MKRPFGVTAVASLFILLAASGLYAGVVGFLAGPDDPLHEAGSLFFLVISFMSAALGIGLWNLEEDARRCAIALFAFPSTMGLIGAGANLLRKNPLSWDELFWISLVLLFGPPAIYLMRPKVKTAFGQLTTLQLTRPH